MSLQRGMAGDDNKITQLFIAPIERNCCGQVVGEICKCCGETIGDGCNCNPGELLFPILPKNTCSECGKPVFAGCNACNFIQETSHYYPVCQMLSNNPELESFNGVKRGQLCYAGIPRGSVCMECSHMASPLILEEHGERALDALSAADLLKDWIVAWGNMRTDNPLRYGLRGNPAHLGYPFLGIRQGSEKGLNIHVGINNKGSLYCQEYRTTGHAFYKFLDIIEVMSKTSAHEIGKRLEALRATRGLRKVALCDAIGISTQAYNNWAKGHNRPDIDAVVLLATFYGCPTDYIITGNLMFLPFELAQKLSAAENAADSA